VGTQGYRAAAICFAEDLSVCARFDISPYENLVGSSNLDLVLGVARILRTRLAVGKVAQNDKIKLNKKRREDAPLIC
jgi:hypothetical protein